MLQRSPLRPAAGAVGGTAVPARLLEAGQARSRYPARAVAGHGSHGGSAVAGPAAGLRQAQRLPALVLESDPSPSRRRY